MSKFNSPSAIELANNDVHLWSVPLQVEDDVLSGLCDLLSVDETTRANRLKIEEKRRQFIVSRACLRILLANYLDDVAESIQFEYTGLGKPTVIDSAIHFNVSHSHHVAVVAVSRSRETGVDRPLGVDVEYYRRDINLAGLSKRYYSPAECVQLDALEGMAKRIGFFRFWTGKESVLKATGQGLSFPLDQLSIQLESDVTAKLIAFGTSLNGHEFWSLRPFTVGEDYIGTLAAEWPVNEVLQFEWNWDQQNGASCQNLR